MSVGGRTLSRWRTSGCERRVGGSGWIRRRCVDTLALADGSIVAERSTVYGLCVLLHALLRNRTHVLEPVGNRLVSPA